MSSKPRTEISTTTVQVLNSQSCVIDMSSAKFHSTVDVPGVVRTGTFVARAYMHASHKWVDLADLQTDPAIERGGQTAEDFLAEFFSDPQARAAASRMRKKVGQHLRPGLAQLRFNAGLSQAELAEKIGTHQSAIARWERNPSQISQESLRKLCPALGISYDEFFAATAHDAPQAAPAQLEPSA